MSWHIPPSGAERVLCAVRLGAAGGREPGFQLPLSPGGWKSSQAARFANSLPFSPREDREAGIPEGSCLNNRRGSSGSLSAAHCAKAPATHELCLRQGQSGKAQSFGNQVLQPGRTAPYHWVPGAVEIGCFGSCVLPVFNSRCAKTNIPIILQEEWLIGLALPEKVPEA